MSRAADMSRLTAELTRSARECLSVVDACRGKTQRAVRAMTDQRQAMAGAQRRTLQERHAQLAGVTANFLRQTAQTRRATASAQLHDLQRGHAQLAGDTAGFLRQTDKTRRTTANAQRHDLQQGHAQLASDSASFLRQTGAARLDMANAQRGSLLRGHVQLTSDTARLLQGFSADLGLVQADSARAGGTWRNFASVMRAVRSHQPAPPARGRAPASKTAPITAPPAVVAPEPSLTPVASEAAPAAASLPRDEEVFAYLANHPDGLRLVEIEEHFRTPRIRLAVILNRLIDANKARRDDERRVYFAS